MAQITGGKVSYGRTVKTGDYENKRCDVELTFSVADGEDYEQMFSLASRQAVRKLEEMLGLTSVKVPEMVKRATESASWTAPAPAAVPQAPVEPPSTPTVEAPAKKRGPGRPPKAAKDEPEVAEAKVEKRAKKDAELADAEIDHPGFTPIPPKADAEPITDKKLIEAVQQKAKTVGPDKVKALRNKFTGSNVNQIITLAQDKRAAFLEALKVLE
jgi:hypothetical protein